MGIISKLKWVSARIRREMQYFRAVAAHPRTPWVAKWCLLAAIAYAAIPFDLIPDFIPVVGQLDDLVIIPALVALGIMMIPADVLEECQ